MESIVNAGLDMGNRNIKAHSNEESPFEFPAAYSRITSEEYSNELYNDDSMYRVKYKGDYFVLGSNCEFGLPANKGEQSKRQYANMFKLVALAEDLRKRGVSEGVYRIVTGTPLQDHEEFYEDYRRLMLTDQEGFEVIEVNGREYRVRVEDVDVYKQSLCVVPTIPQWKEKDIIIFDFGGGTFDVAAVFGGVKKAYLTIDFSLNKVLEDLGNKLNSHKLGIRPRPNSSNTEFIDKMEDIILKGAYKTESAINIDGTSVDLKRYCADYIQARLDEIIDNAIEKIDLSSSDLKSVEVFCIGGGSKLQEDQLKNNGRFKNLSIVSNPEFANVTAYLVKANANKGWK